MIKILMYQFSSPFLPKSTGYLPPLPHVRIIGEYILLGSISSRKLQPPNFLKKLLALLSLSFDILIGELLA